MKTSLLLAAAAMPRAVAMSPLASIPAAVQRSGRQSPAASGGDPSVILRDINAALEDFKDRHGSRMDDLEAAIGETNTRLAAFGLEGGISAGVPKDPEYSRQFASYVAKGNEGDLHQLNAEGYRANLQAALSVGTASEGGYLAPTEWDRKIHKRLREVSPMRRICTTVSTAVAAFSTVWHDDLWGSGWVGETAARPATTSPLFSALEFASGEIYANVPITQRLLDDSQLDMESWLAEQIGEEFERQEDIAFLSGNGTNKPFGILAYVTGGAADGRHPGGNLTIVNSGQAAAIDGDGLIGFAYSLPAKYRQGAVWLMNSSTAASLAKLKDGDGNYIWREGLIAGQPATLLGYPVEIDEGMPALAADATPIAFGNFQRGYLINDRIGTRILRDPYTNKPFVNFYATKRVGGGVLDPNAIRLLKVAA